MLDMWHISEGSTGVSKLFNYYGGASTTQDWQPYIIPRGHSMVRVLCVGGGGGGSGGGGNATATNRGGGAGGGSGAITSVTVPRILLPETLFIMVGCGGNGGAEDTSGSTLRAAQASYVSFQPAIVTAGSLLCLANGGSGGTFLATGGGAGGAAGTASGATTAVFFGVGLYTNIAGQVGAAGGDDAGAGVNVTWGATGVFVSGGASGGGGNTGFAGGNITGDSTFAMVPTISGGGVGVAGGAGYANIPKMMFTGGSGGGGNAGVGGAGGRGSLGSGGGGGGGGTNNNAGVGGDGGNGFVVITSW